MDNMQRIIRHSSIYIAISALLVLLAIAVTTKFAIRDIEEDLDIPLVKTLASYASALDGGTVNSRAMGAAILLGLENRKAKLVALGQQPENEPEVLATLETLRTLYYAELVFIVNQQGIIVAYSSKDDTHGVGRKLAFRPYVKLAMQGTPNVYPAVGVISPDRGIYLAAPLRASTSNSSKSIGVVVIKIGGDKLDALLKTWTDGSAALVSPQGIVFATSREDWRFRSIGELSRSKIADIQRDRQFGTVFDLPQPPSLPFALDKPETNIDGVHYAVRSVPLEWNDPGGDWMLAFLQKRAPWWTHW